MIRDVPASKTRVNMPVASPRDMRVSRNSRLRKRRGPGKMTTDWIPATWILDYNGWNPDSISWIPDSIVVDSGFHRPKLPGFRIPDSGLPYMGRQLKVNFFVLLRVVLLVSQA